MRPASMMTSIISAVTVNQSEADFEFVAVDTWSDRVSWRKKRERAKEGAVKLTTAEGWTTDELEGPLREYREEMVPEVEGNTRSI